MNESQREELLRGLRRIQHERYLSLKGLASLLGFSTAYLSMLFSGQRRPSRRFLRAVATRFPELGENPADRPQASREDTI